MEEYEWKVLPDISQERGNCYAILNDGKFFVIDSKLDGDIFERSVDVYDLKRGAWTTIQEEEFPLRFDCIIASPKGARFFSVYKQEGAVMEYDSKENVWRDLCSLSEALAMWNDREPMITTCIGWCDMIFISVYAKGISPNVEAYYMLKPPPKGSVAGAQGENFGKWEAIERPQESHVDYLFEEIIFSVAVEI